METIQINTLRVCHLNILLSGHINVGSRKVKKLINWLGLKFKMKVRRGREETKLDGCQLSIQTLKDKNIPPCVIWAYKDGDFFRYAKAYLKKRFRAVTLIEDPVPVQDYWIPKARLPALEEGCMLDESPVVGKDLMPCIKKVYKRVPFVKGRVSPIWYGSKIGFSQRSDREILRGLDDFYYRLSDTTYGIIELDREKCLAST